MTGERRPAVSPVSPDTPGWWYVVISVLYVDDEPAFLDLTKMYLEKMGKFSVEVADSAVAALAMIETRQYDVIVSDYQMPGMDDIAFLKEIRKRGNTVPFIIFTGKGREEVVIEAFESGADFYLQKGGDVRPQFAELERKITKAVELSKAEHDRLESEERLRQIIDFLPDATFAIDTEGKVIAWNRAMERMTGVPAGDILEKGNFEYAIPFYHERRPILIDLVLGEYPGIEAKYPTFRREGRKFYAEITIPHLRQGKGAALWFTASPLYDTQGRITGAIESIRDITEKKRAAEALEQINTELHAAYEQLSATEEELRQNYDELSKKEQMLRESEKLYRTIFETTGTATVLVENDGTINLANSEFVRLSGLSREEIENRKKWMDFVVREDLDRMVKQHRLRRSEPDRALKNYEFRFLSGTGEVRHIYLTVALIPGTQKSITSLLDITPLKKAEEALLEANRDYISLLDQIQDVYYRSDREGNLVKASRSWALLLGYDDVSECIGRPIAGDFYYNPEDRRKFLEELYRNGKVTNYEVILRKKDGSPVLVSTSSHLVHAPDGTVLGVEGTFRDISEQKRAEEALRESEERYRRIFSTMPSAVVVYEAVDGGEDFIIRDFNPKAEETEHITRHEVIGRRVTEVFPGVREFGLLPVFQRVWKTGEEAYLPPALCRDDRGPETWRENWIYRVSSGEIVAIYNDVTDWVRAQEALRESEERYRSIVENIQDIYYRTDDKGTIIMASPSAVLALGYGSLEEIIGKPVESFWVYPECRKEMLQQITAQGRVTDYEVLIKKKDGTPLQASVTSTFYYDHDGSILGVEGIIRDITERKQAEEALRQSEERFRNYMENAPDGIFLADREGNYLMVNKAACEMTGYAREELLGKNIRDLIAPSDQDLGFAHFRKVKEEGIAVGDSRYVTKSGDVRYWLVKAVRISEGNLLGFASDITERKHVEEALHMANHKLSLLSSITRHDIKNQLTIIQGYANILKEEQSDSSMSEKIGIIEKASERIADMIRFTKEYENVGVETPTWHDVRQLVDSVAQELHLGRVRLSNDLPGGTEIFADPLTRRVVFNLMDNSLRYGEKVTTIRFSGEERDDSYIIVCEDDGVGIPPGEKEEIFSRGYGKNTGMGLFFSREILAITGITITENGEPGKGARFEIGVPMGKYRKVS